MGFPAEGIQFLEDLENNNNKEWFDARKDIYKTQLVEPAIALVETFGTRLQADISDGIQFDTRTNGAGSLMRIYRDTRFSKDKSPYKTYLGIAWWEGPKKKTENPSFFFHMDANGGVLHVGMHGFDKPLLEAYRQAVVDDTLGAELAEIVEAVEAAGYNMNSNHYKRVPNGYDKDHPRADLLLHKGLGASSPTIPRAQIQSAELVDICIAHAKAMAPLHQWLVRLNQMQMA